MNLLTFLIETAYAQWRGGVRRLRRVPPAMTPPSPDLSRWSVGDRAAIYGTDRVRKDGVVRIEWVSNPAVPEPYRQYGCVALTNLVDWRCWPYRHTHLAGEHLLVDGRYLRGIGEPKPEEGVALPHD